MRGPLGNAGAVGQQVIANGDVLGQRVAERYVNQVNKGVAPHRDDLAMRRVERYVQCFVPR